MASTGTKNKTDANIAASAAQQPAPHHEHDHTCNDPSHHHDMPSFFDPNDLQSVLAAAKNDARTAKRKGKKNQKQAYVIAETIPGHRGNENIDDLVNFINGPSPPSTNDKQNKKKSTTN